MKAIALRCLAAVLGLLFLCLPLAAGAQMTPSQEIVEKARITVEKLRHDPEFAALNAYLAKAKGVLVVPSLLKAGFFLGAEGGSGVLLGRRPAGDWGYPAFVTLGAGSIGLQIGVQDAEVIFVIMNDKALSQVVRNPVKFGADASLAIGPIGAGVSAGTTLNLDADIYSFAKTSGLYGGGSFEGTVIYPREVRNQEFYGRPAPAREIVLEHKLTSAAAEPLRAALAKPRP